MTSRREFLQRSAAYAGGVALTAADGPTTAARRVGATAPPPSSFVDLHRPPDLVAVETATGVEPLARAGDGAGDLAGTAGWQRGAGRASVRVATRPLADGALRVELAAPGTAVLRLRLRWRGPLDATRLVLGDALERGYGDLEWRGMVPDRLMPWYVATWDGRRTHAYGVRTGAVRPGAGGRPAAFCFWQVDPTGVTLWADVRSGGAGLALGDRTLAVCDVVARPGREGESPFAALHDFCRQMSPAPRLPARPVYGSNDWYWAYGQNSASSVAADAERIVALSPTGANRPFAVIDAGWEPEASRERGGERGRGMWDRGNEKFGDMAAVAAGIRRAGARPGIWYRPLVAPADAPASWRLPRRADALDPSVPDVLERVAADVARLRGWGYELIKHDFSTYDVLGRWGFEMGPGLTAGNWTFAAGPTRTTAEVLDGLYAAIRRAAGDGPDGALVIGCNTVTHLSAGRFELTRAGDDTSGQEWARTRKMGVNTLAFRAVQHGAFYAVDADCVGVTTAVPWAQNRQWLDLLARSGTPLFVSLAPDAVGAEQRRDLRAALARAAGTPNGAPQPLGEPLDWQGTTIPARWRLGGEERRYAWMDDAGAPLGA